MTAGMREEIRVGQLAIRFLVESGDSNRAVAVFEFDVPAGAKVPLAHSHDGYEETIYGLEGVLNWTVEGMSHAIGGGEALCIPRGAVHHFDNTGDVDARALAIVTPGILGPEYFREVAEVLDAAAGDKTHGGCRRFLGVSAANRRSRHAEVHRRVRPLPRGARSDDGGVRRRARTRHPCGGRSDDDALQQPQRRVHGRLGDPPVALTRLPARSSGWPHARPHPQRPSPAVPGIPP